MPNTTAASGVGTTASAGVTVSATSHTSEYCDAEEANTPAESSQTGLSIAGRGAVFIRLSLQNESSAETKVDTARIQHDEQRKRIKLLLDR
jgi:hypothetical protein